MKLDHPRIATGQPWVAHTMGKQLAPSLTPSGQPFWPVVQYKRQGEQLHVFWGDQPTFADDLDHHERVTLLRAFACSDLIQGCKIWGVPEIVHIEGQTAPESMIDPEQAVLDSTTFKPFAYYDRETDTLLVRWQTGVEVEELIDDQSGHPLTMIVNREREPEDSADQKPWRLVGVKIHDISSCVPIVR